MKTKLHNLLDSKILLKSAFLKHLLTTARNFSLITHKQNSNVVETINQSCQKTFEKILKDQNSVLELPTLKAVVVKIECNSDTDEEPI